MLSGVRRANADNTRSVVWNRVEIYTVDTTLARRLKIILEPVKNL
jgi:hypothetical protein